MDRVTLQFQRICRAHRQQEDGMDARYTSIAAIATGLEIGEPTANSWV